MNKKIMTVIDVVCNHYEIDYSELKSNSRKGVHTYPRMIIIYILMEKKLCTSIAAGALFNRDHSTALHAKKTFENLCVHDKVLVKETNELIKKIDSKSTDLFSVKSRKNKLFKHVLRSSSLPLENQKELLKEFISLDC